MLTTERLEALTAVENGTVTARLQNAAGSRPLFEPRKHTVALGFLERTGMVRLETEYKPHKKGAVCTVHVTERGRHVLARSTA